ncbi:MAG: hypothetical protein HC817_00465 [Saprospiraceae bacterium]|nr:hypothetical protein [Saprospiraceae bacterium]
MQFTKERDPDELSKVELANGEEQILHAEVHLKDEQEVNLRMCEYYVMLKRREKKLDIVQYIIFIGSEDPKHITGFYETDVLKYRYNLIVLKIYRSKFFFPLKTPRRSFSQFWQIFKGKTPKQ